jgi:AcrR family transcriptional regulator
MTRIERPANARSRQTRAAILDAAWQLIEEHGGEHLTMEAVAERARISRRAVYLHFGSRADLFTALLGHIDAALDLESSVRPMREAATPAAALEAWARHVAAYHARILPVVRAVDQARRSDGDARALWDQAMGAWLGACRSIAAAIAEAGELDAHWTVETAADLLWALMSVDLLEDLQHDRGWPGDVYAERLALVARRSLLRGR